MRMHRCYHSRFQVSWDSGVLTNATIPRKHHPLPAVCSVQIEEARGEYPLTCCEEIYFTTKFTSLPGT